MQVLISARMSVCIPASKCLLLASTQELITCFQNTYIQNATSCKAGDTVLYWDHWGQGFRGCKFTILFSWFFWTGFTFRINKTVVEWKTYLKECWNITWLLQFGIQDTFLLYRVDWSFSCLGILEIQSELFVPGAFLINLKGRVVSCRVALRLDGRPSPDTGTEQRPWKRGGW